MNIKLQIIALLMTHVISMIKLNSRTQADVYHLVGQLVGHWVMYFERNTNIYNVGNSNFNHSKNIINGFTILRKTLRILTKFQGVRVPLRYFESLRSICIKTAIIQIFIKFKVK